MAPLNHARAFDSSAFSHRASPTPLRSIPRADIQDQGGSLGEWGDELKDEAGFWRAPWQKAALDRRCRRTASPAKETDLSLSPEVRCRRRGPECRRNAPWHEAANPAYLRGCGASCP